MAEVHDENSATKMVYLDYVIKEPCHSETDLDEKCYLYRRNTVWLLRKFLSPKLIPLSLNESHRKMVGKSRRKRWHFPCGWGADDSR